MLQAIALPLAFPLAGDVMVRALGLALPDPVPGKVALPGVFLALPRPPRWLTAPFAPIVIQWFQWRQT